MKRSHEPRFARAERLHVYLRRGPPVWISGLGMLPGPVDRIVLRDEVLVVDDHHPGEDIVFGAVVARTVTHAEAVALWCAFQASSVGTTGAATETVGASQPPGDLSASGQPVSSWEAVAEVLGVSVWTVRRRRKERNDRREPYFPGPEAVHAWWADLTAPAPPAQTTRRRKGTRVAGRAVDWDSVKP